jgi:hypothetical protein
MVDMRVVVKEDQEVGEKEGVDEVERVRVEEEVMEVRVKVAMVEMEQAGMGDMAKKTQGGEVEKVGVKVEGVGWEEMGLAVAEMEMVVEEAVRVEVKEGEGLGEEAMEEEGDWAKGGEGGEGMANWKGMGWEEAQHTQEGMERGMEGMGEKGEVAGKEEEGKAETQTSEHHTAMLSCG